MPQTATAAGAVPVAVTTAGAVPDAVTAVGMVLLMVCVLAAAWAVSRFLGQRLGTRAPGRRVRVLEQTPLGGDRSLALVEYRRYRYLLGVASSGITVIDKVEARTAEDLRAAAASQKRNGADAEEAAENAQDTEKPPESPQGAAGTVRASARAALLSLRKGLSGRKEGEDG